MLSMCGEMSKEEREINGEMRRQKASEVEMPWVCPGKQTSKSAWVGGHCPVAAGSWKIYLELTNVSTWLEAWPILNLGFEPCPIVLACTCWGTELAHIVLSLQPQSHICAQGIGLSIHVTTLRVRKLIWLSTIEWFQKEITTLVLTTSSPDFSWRKQDDEN